jgi:putative ABC transport system permease protein
MMRFYRALLYLYPASFRAEYGEEMCAVLAARQTSYPAAIWDVLRNAPAVHGDILRQDLRYTVRTLGRARGFAIVAVLVLALGIGANTAVFSVTDYVLIRALPFPAPDRLVRVWESLPGYKEMELSPVNYRDWKQLNTVFDEMAGVSTNSVNLVGQGDPARIKIASVTGSLFSVLGVQPLVGRSIDPRDDQKGAPLTVVLGYGLWKRMFGSDAAVLGRKVNLDGMPHTVIGVMPSQFHFPEQSVELWVPFQFADPDFADRNDNYVEGIARLRRGVSVEQAQAAMSQIADQLRLQYPNELAHTGATVVPMRNDFSDQARLLLVALSGTALCVLLIACTNLANLLLARALARQKELAVRSALGAGRERLIRQLGTESMVLCLLGGLFGVFLADLALPLLTRLVPALPVAGTPSLDLRVLGFAAIITIITGMAFGILPALQVSRKADFQGLREGSRSGGVRKAGLRSALILTEVTLSVVLLVSAGLLLRALMRIQSVDPGFRSDSVLTLQTALPMPKYEVLAKRVAFYRQVLSQVRALPGVSEAGYTSFLPMTLGGGIWPVDVDGKTLDRSENHSASLRFVTPGFFPAMRIPLLDGRNLDESDVQGRPLVAVVSESFTRRYWPGQSPLGRHFKFAFLDRTVVGVVGNVRVRGLERTSEPQVYLPYQQASDGYLPFYAPKDLVIRTSANPGPLLPLVSRIAHDADPEQPISNVRTLDEIVQADTAPRFVQLRIIAAFAVLALVLAGIGLHGLLSFTVSNRSSEIAVRVALGAQSRDILRIVLQQSVLLAAGGVIVGMALAYAAGRAMQALLAGVPPADPSTFLVSAALCLLMTMAGGLLPSLRALRVDPVIALRSE